MVMALVPHVCSWACHMCHMSVHGLVTCATCVFMGLSHVPHVCLRACHMCHRSAIGLITCVTCVSMVLPHVSQVCPWSFHMCHMCSVLWCSRVRNRAGPSETVEPGDKETLAQICTSSTNEAALPPHYRHGMQQLAPPGMQEFAPPGMH